MATDFYANGIVYVRPLPNIESEQIYKIGSSMRIATRYDGTNAVELYKFERYDRVYIIHYSSTMDCKQIDSKLRRDIHRGFLRTAEHITNSGGEEIYCYSGNRGSNIFLELEHWFKKNSFPFIIAPPNRKEYDDNGHLKIPPNMNVDQFVLELESRMNVGSYDLSLFISSLEIQKKIAKIQGKKGKENNLELHIERIKKILTNYNISFYFNASIQTIDKQHSNNNNIKDNIITFSSQHNNMSENVDQNVQNNEENNDDKKRQNDENKEWKCYQCTLLNASSVELCTMCGTTKSIDLDGLFSSFESVTSLAVSSMQNNDFEKALEHLKNGLDQLFKYMTNIPSDKKTIVSAAYYNRAFCYGKLHKYNDALIAINKCVSIVPNMNAPKKPQTSFFLFMNERRPILRKLHTDKSMTDISKLISTEWKSLLDKSKYIDKAAKLKEKHKEEMNQYKKSVDYRKYQKTLMIWKQNEFVRQNKNDDKKEQNDKNYNNNNQILSDNHNVNNINKRKRMEPDIDEQNDEKKKENIAPNKKKRKLMITYPLRQSFNKTLCDQNAFEFKNDKTIKLLDCDGLWRLCSFGDPIYNTMGKIFRIEFATRKTKRISDFDLFFKIHIGFATALKPTQDIKQLIQPKHFKQDNLGFGIVVQASSGSVKNFFCDSQLVHDDDEEIISKIDEFGIIENGKIGYLSGIDVGENDKIFRGDTFMLEHNFESSWCTVYYNQKKMGTLLMKSKCILPIISIYGITNRVKFEVSRYEISNI